MFIWELLYIIIPIYTFSIVRQTSTILIHYGIHPVIQIVYFNAPMFLNQNDNGNIVNKKIINVNLQEDEFTVARLN